jgi:hypothetical protein
LRCCPPTAAKSKHCWRSDSAPPDRFPAPSNCCRWLCCGISGSQRTLARISEIVVVLVTRKAKPERAVNPPDPVTFEDGNGICRPCWPPRNRRLRRR